MSDLPASQTIAEPTAPTDSQFAAPMETLAPPQPLPTGVWILLAFCLAGLGLHIWQYRFLCDDAFISFRYSRNLAHGFGLVFNPGHERVEGYSNFLWVLILAAGQLVGIAPEHAANPLLIFCGLAIVFLVVRYCHQELSVGVSPYWIVAPAALLAINRSFAMWCTSGLETKLYELLVVAGVLMTIREMDAMAAGKSQAFPWSALMFALAAMTRPDGVLYAICVVATRAVCQAWVRSFKWRPLLTGVVVFAVPVAGQYLFRHWYYDDWFPNTYYAKVGGQTWWEMGFKYLAAFALEYAMILWVPVILLAIFFLARVKRLHVALIIAAAIVPHAIYVAGVGGDHFEWRVLDAYLPLLAIFFFYAGCNFARHTGAQLTTAAYTAITLAAGLVLPQLSHIQYPPDYRVGFPGLAPRDGYLTEFIDSTQSPWLFQIPYIGKMATEKKNNEEQWRSYVVIYNDLMYQMTRQFVGLRQEEHKGFLATAEKQGQWLSDLIAKGVLPADLHIATDCVGAIPYRTNLRVLDRVGLTDRTVSRQQNAKGNYRVMAHDKMATDEYIKQMGVDISVLDNVHLILPWGNPRILFYGHIAQNEPQNQVFADVGDGRILLGTATQGVEALQRRLPRLKLEPAGKLVKMTIGENGENFQPVSRDRQFGPPYDLTYFEQGLGLQVKGYVEATLLHWKCALWTNPNNPMARGNVAGLTEWIKRQRAAGLPVNRPPPPGMVTGPGDPPPLGSSEGKPRNR